MFCLQRWLVLLTDFLFHGLISVVFIKPPTRPAISRANFTIVVCGFVSLAIVLLWNKANNIIRNEYKNLYGLSLLSQDLVLQHSGDHKRENTFEKKNANANYWPSVIPYFEYCSVIVSLNAVKITTCKIS